MSHINLLERFMLNSWRTQFLFSCNCSWSKYQLQVSLQMFSNRGNCELASFWWVLGRINNLQFSDLRQCFHTTGVSIALRVNVFSDVTNFRAPYLSWQRILKTSKHLTPSGSGNHIWSCSSKERRKSYRTICGTAIRGVSASRWSHVFTVVSDPSLRKDGSFPWNSGLRQRWGATFVSLDWEDSWLPQFFVSEISTGKWRVLILVRSRRTHETVNSARELIIMALHLSVVTVL